MTDLYTDILQKSPILLGMTENSPEDVFSALFDALVAEGCLSADLREVARAAVNAREASGSSIDGEPSRIFVLILNHPGSRDHVRFLAAVNRRLIIPEVRAALLLAKTRDEALRLLAG